MASLDSLPADQRAVLQLVLQRGRSYDDIARLLSIDRAAVRERALAAFDALGPQTRVPPERRALITDYLLGQLPARVAAQTREHLAQSATERAWARVLGSELSPLARETLPEIPVEAAGRAAAFESPAPARADQAAPTSRAEPAERVVRSPAGADWGDDPPRQRRDPAAHPSSRRGGALLLGGGALVVVVVVLVIVLVSGGSGKSVTSSTPSAAASIPTTSTPTTATTTGTSTTGTSTTGTSTTAANGAKLLAQVNLTSPTGSKKTAGVAQVIKEGANTGLVIVAQGIAANTAHDAYAVWLYNSASDEHLLGFVNPGVKSDGKLQTAGVLPATASRYKQLLVTLETQAKPHAPGTIVLQGAINIP